MSAFWSKVDASGDCWIWTAYLNEKGYGRYRNHLAHRFAYEELVGPITPDLELDHLCQVHSCVNPDHLEQVTHAENLRRSKRAMAALARTHVTKTHCPQGHSYDEANTLIRPNGWRRCRECERRDSLARYHRRKAMA